MGSRRPIWVAGDPCGALEVKTTGNPHMLFEWNPFSSFSCHVFRTGVIEVLRWIFFYHRSCLTWSDNFCDRKKKNRRRTVIFPVRKTWSENFDQKYIYLMYKVSWAHSASRAHSAPLGGANSNVVRLRKIIKDNFFF